MGGEWERTEEFNRGSSGNQGSFSFDGSVTGVAFADYLNRQAGEPDAERARTSAW